MRLRAMRYRPRPAARGIRDAERAKCSARSAEEDHEYRSRRGLRTRSPRAANSRQAGWRHVDRSRQLRQRPKARRCSCAPNRRSRSRPYGNARRAPPGSDRARDRCRRAAHGPRRSEILVKVCADGCAAIEENAAPRSELVVRRRGQRRRAGASSPRGSIASMKRSPSALTSVAPSPRKRFGRERSGIDAGIDGGRDGTARTPHRRSPRPRARPWRAIRPRVGGIGRQREKPADAAGREDDRAGRKERIRAIAEGCRPDRAERQPPGRSTTMRSSAS